MAVTNMIVKVNKKDLSKRECYHIQFFGPAICRTCDLKDTRKCTGKKILKTGKNKCGSKVPILWRQK